MLISAPTFHDMKEWINAFRMHQIDTMEARSKFFEKKLERSGVKVPRASILMTKGLNAPLQATAMARTMSAGPNNLRTFSEIKTDLRDAQRCMSAIGEEQEEEEYKEQPDLLLNNSAGM